MEEKGRQSPEFQRGGNPEKDLGTLSEWPCSSPVRLWHVGDIQIVTHLVSYMHNASAIRTIATQSTS